MILNSKNIRSYREKLVRELHALDVVLKLFQGEPDKPWKMAAAILNEVKKPKKKTLSKMQKAWTPERRKAQSQRMKERMRVKWAKVKVAKHGNS